MTHRTLWGSAEAESAPVMPLPARSYMAEARAADAERFAFLAGKLESAGQKSAAEMAARWSREHQKLSRELRRGRN